MFSMFIVILFASLLPATFKYSSCSSHKRLSKWSKNVRVAELSFAEVHNGRIHTRQQGQQTDFERAVRLAARPAAARRTKTKKDVLSHKEKNFAIWKKYLKCIFTFLLRLHWKLNCNGRLFLLLLLWILWWPPRSAGWTSTEMHTTPAYLMTTPLPFKEWPSINV